MAPVIFVAIVVGAALTGWFFQPGEWYRRLRKPDWTPPDWAFPLVWSILYAMIAAAGWLVWRAGEWSPALFAWGAQIVANGAWSWLFFGLRRMRLALADIGAMWILIVAFMVLAWPLSPVASMLFAPYLAWVTTAGLLNYSVLRLNLDDPAASR